MSGKFHNALYNTRDSIQIDTPQILESRPEPSVERAIQTQEVSHLPQMIDTPEALSLALAIRALKPWQPKSTRVKGTSRIRGQKGLDIRMVHLGEKVSSVLAVVCLRN